MLHIISYEWSRSVFVASAVCFVWDAKLDFPTSHSFPSHFSISVSSLSISLFFISHSFVSISLFFFPFLCLPLSESVIASSVVAFRWWCFGGEVEMVVEFGGGRSAWFTWVMALGLIDVSGFWRSVLGRGVWLVVVLVIWWWVWQWQWVWISMVVCGSVGMEILVKILGLWCVNVVVVVAANLWVVVVV